ncbi:class I SAM-dependent methyltransferase [Pseudohalocynthiibacter aestuariivivens]|nr:class I SAM-dependent methyltransferase [Pseudohalocynthiibacter aestuariivivens]QIE44811.1 class I SAM-dependent methyltransferase [Pseudohalocynthiibacter aestuariivivens]
MTHSHVTINRDHWNAMASDWAAEGARAWASDVPYWGAWSLPEHDLRLLPEDMTGMDAIELGCGTGYVSAWMARRGARVTGIDMSEGQLDTARRLASEHCAQINFAHGNAESVDRPASAFDFAISEYGAAIWCDPTVWLPEAHRLLRPGGRLVFLGHHPLMVACIPPSGADCERVLHVPYRGMNRQDYTEVSVDPGGIEFNMPVSDWMALFEKIGFGVIRYQELYAPESATEDAYGIPAEWAKAYPCEQVWHLQKRA